MEARQELMRYDKLNQLIKLEQDVKGFIAKAGIEKRKKKTFQYPIMALLQPYNLLRTRL